MAKASSRNLTEGRELPLILSFIFPVMLGMLFQQFYNVTDSIIVGHFLGKGALAATGGTGSITFLIIGFANGFAGGLTIPVSQRFGAGDERNLRRYAANGILLGGALGVVLMLLSVLLCRSILTWMQTPADIFEDSYLYLVVILAGIPITVYYNLLSSYIRALGDSATPVKILAVSSVVNIVLTALLVVATPLGVAGAAIATIAAQLVSCVLSLLFILRRLPILRLSREDFRLSRTHISVLLVNGVPMGLQYSITAIGSVILSASVNLLGTDAVAAVSAANKVLSFFSTLFEALGATMATWAGQHVGAAKMPRLRTGVRLCLVCGVIYGLLCLGIYLLFGDTLALLFLDAAEVSVIADAQRLMVAYAIGYPLLTMVNTIRFTIQGMGFGRFAMLSGVMEMIARTVAGVWFVPALGFLGVCVASPFAWVLANCFLVPAYFFCYRKLAAQLTRQSPAA